MAWTERYVRSDADGTGDGTTDANSGANGSWTIGQAITNAAAGIRINVKNGTYSSSVLHSFAVAGTSASPIWWRGFNSTIGDLDGVADSTNFPYFSYTSNGYFGMTAEYNWFENLRITSSTATAARGTFYLAGGSGIVKNCKIRYTGTTTVNAAIVGTGASDTSYIIGCHIESTYNASGHVTVTMPSNGRWTMVRCYVKGGYDCLRLDQGGIVYGNIFDSPARHCIIIDASETSTIVQNTFYNAASSGIAIFSPDTAGGILIAGNVFHTMGARGITSTDVHPCAIVDRNVYYNCTSGNTNNLYQDEEFHAVTASSSPLVDPSNGDFTPQGEAIGAGSGNRWLGLPDLVGYRDAGAIQLGA